MASLTAAAQGADDNALHFFDTPESSDVKDHPKNFMDPMDMDVDNPSQHMNSSKVLHLSLDHQTIGQNEKGRQHDVLHMDSSNVDRWLHDKD